MSSIFAFSVLLAPLAFGVAVAVNGPIQTPTIGTDELGLPRACCEAVRFGARDRI